MLWFVSPRPDARAQAARSDTLPVGGIVRLSVGRHRGRLGVRCVRMGSRAADESAATEGARPDDGGQDDTTIDGIVGFLAEHPEPPQL